jgi:hypothetical protein
MKTVWKFELPVADQVKIKMPHGAKVLHVEAQYSNVYVWALVDDEHTFVEHKFYVHGTGHKADDVADLPFIGSLVMMGGAFVAHVWDGGE